MAAIARLEPGSGLPPGLLGAIARVESGWRMEGMAQPTPWPWTANIEGTGAHYPDKAQAVAAIRAAQRDGSQSIDVGCMQINLMHHPDAFGSLEDGFDPRSNVAYAIKFLNQLHAQAGEWPKAIGLYHSATVELASAYKQRVMAFWQRGDGASGETLALAPLPAIAPGPGSGGAGLFASPFGRAAAPSMVRARPTETVAGLSGRGLDAYRAMPIRPARLAATAPIPRSAIAPIHPHLR